MYLSIRPAPAGSYDVLQRPLSRANTRVVVKAGVYDARPRASIRFIEVFDPAIP